MNFFVKNRHAEEGARGVFYSALEAAWRREQKYGFLERVATRENVHWTKLQPDPRNRWLRSGLHSEYDAFLGLGSKKEDRSQIFAEYSHGINTQRDTDVYNFNYSELLKSVRGLAEAYNSEADRWVRKGRPKDLDAFVDYKKLKWSRNLKRHPRNLDRLEPNSDLLLTSLYRPFTTAYVFYGEIAVDEMGKMQSVFPPADGSKNVCVCVTAVGSEKPFFTLASACIPNYHLTGAGSGTQCFPFYTYSEDGTHRRENITDWALEQFRARYHDPSITKWGIFYYIYAVLHHPEYRERYAANLRRELPRIPFVSAIADSTISCHSEPGAKPCEEPAVLPAAGEQQIPPSGRNDKTFAGTDSEVFRSFVAAGKRLAEIHVHYEQQPEYKLTKVEKAGEKLDYRVTKMKLSKDRTTLIYNQFLTLSGIPKETYEYRLGNRSALEWVIDQYQISTDKRSGITNDPNRLDDPQYILRLIGQVISVSVETVKIVGSFPDLGLPE
ncbi:MAG: type ISP restriction/modification enzyme [Candidatus Sulfotelmatobacter sp.]